jgi:hypothetical protein
LIVAGCRTGLLFTTVCVIQSIKDCPELVVVNSDCRIIPWCARPEREPDANERNANCDQRDAQSSHTNYA